MMSTEHFFSEASGQSRVKSAIVAKYFATWATVMMSVQDRQASNDNRIAYMDLFAGPGKYDDGTPSTPLRILSSAIADDKMRNRLVTLFNDRDEAAVESLRNAIGQIPDIDTLKHPPEVRTFEVGHEVVEWLEKSNLIPSLVFLDPWGYKGLSLDLVISATKDWGCDCILFFNYNRVNMGLNNPAVKERMEALFGAERADNLRRKLAGLSSEDRELMIVESLYEVLYDSGRYVLPFRFKDDRGTRTSHHLFLVTKNLKGYEIMKDIMAKESSEAEQGVPSFEYNRAAKYRPRMFPLLAEFAPRPIDDLADMLMEKYAGKTISMEDIYHDHNVGRPFVKSNYKRALMKLEDEGKIIVPKHRKGTFGDKVLATFPDI